MSVASATKNSPTYVLRVARGSIDMEWVHDISAITAEPCRRVVTLEVRPRRIAADALEYLIDRDRPRSQAILRRAYRAADGKTAQRLPLDLARRLETEYPSAAESVREGLDETLTVLTLKLSPRLRRSPATTNAVESLITRTRLVKRNVKRCRGG